VTRRQDSEHWLLSFFALIDHPGLPQDAEVMGEHRLGDRKIERPAASPRRILGQAADNAKALGVG
jgi:hypothetical protein